MSRYTPLVEFQTVFEEDTVTMELDQLTRKQFLSWMPYMSEVDDEGKLSTENTMKLVNEAADLIPEYVKNFKGLKDMDGVAITLETVVKKVYFMTLVSEIVMELIQNSQVGKGIEVPDEKNSEGPQLV